MGFWSNMKESLRETQELAQQAERGKKMLNAAKSGDIKAVSRYLEGGANPDEKDSNGATALMHASEQGHLKVVEILLQNDASINLGDSEYNMTALMLAASEGHIETVRLLVSSGADVNAKDSNLQATALMTSAEYGYIEIVKLLIEHGADANAKNKTAFTALHLTISNGHFDTVKILVSAGANINVKDNEYGLTPTMVAALKGEIEIIQYLINNNAKITKTIKAKNGMTTKELAETKRHSKAAKLLCKYENAA